MNRKSRTLVALGVLCAACLIGYGLLRIRPPSPSGPAGPARDGGSATAAAPVAAPASVAAPGAQAAAPTDGGRADGGTSLAIDGRVTVAVHHPDGSAAAGADVEVVWHGAPKAGQALGVTPFYVQDIPPMSPKHLPDGALGPDLEGTTATDGRHVFTGLVAGYYQISAAAAVGPSAGAWFGIDAAHPTMDVSLTLTPVTTLDVTVVDTAGQPVAGAEFRGRTWPPTAAPKATTDAAGKVALGVPTDGATQLRLTAHGKSPAVIRFGPGGPHRVVLKAAGVVSGTVMADGAPAAGAVVGIPFDELCPKVTTGDDGTFTLACLPRKIVGLQATRGARESHTLQVDARRGKVRGVVLTLLAQEVLDVHVVTPKGDPVSDATVRIATPGVPVPPEDAGSPWLTWHPVDEDGRLEITPVPHHAVYVIEAKAPGRPRAQRMYRNAAGKVPIELVLPEGTEVSFRVLDPEGNAIRGHGDLPTVVVERQGRGAWPYDLHLPMPPGKTEVDAALAPGTYMVVANASGDLVIPPRTVKVPDQDSVSLRSVHGVLLTGRAVDPSGQGIPGLRLILHPAKGTHAVPGYARTGDGGELRSQAPIPPGRYVPDLLMSGVHWRIPPGTTLVAGAGPQTLHLLPARTVVGDILDAKGHLVRFVEVRLVHQGAPKLTVVGGSGETGHFVVGHLVPGRYTLTVDDPGFRPMTVTTGETGLVVHLPPGG